MCDHALDTISVVMEKVSRLRQLCYERNLAAYIVPTDDAHQSEYIADCDKRREYLSGFSGSAGLVVVTHTEALLWTDGRYHLQASKELDLNVWTLMRQGNEGVLASEEWLAQHVAKGDLIGFDPTLLSHETFQKYSKALKEGYGGELASVPDNLVDMVWSQMRPPPPNSHLLVLSTRYSGKSWHDKVEAVRMDMTKTKSSVLVVTALDEIAWLFNLRGSDIDFNPVFIAYAIVTMKDARLYVSEDRIRLPSLVEHLTGVKLCLYSQVFADLQDLIGGNRDSKIWISDSSSQALVECVADEQRCSQISPIQLLKGVKNSTEILGMKNCHVRDSAALCEYLCWLEQEVPTGKLNEVTAADKLDSLRKELPDFVSLSFPTISSSGPNGAVIHYRPNIKTARSLSVDELYLCDSGGQYLDGTTDVTRTVSFGKPSAKEKECFTLVLKGHIALCTAIFPDKTMGNQLDCLARSSLWALGLDYKHGTGHGVGAFLNVHEGPHGIGKSRNCAKPLQAGMFVTDEPGYYEDNTFGIRIENVEVVKVASTKYRFGEVDYLSMEPVTLVPIQHKLIEVSLLSDKEVRKVDWINSYHATCQEVVGQYLKEQGKISVLEWLQRETKTLSTKIC